MSYGCRNVSSPEEGHRLAMRWCKTSKHEIKEIPGAYGFLSSEKSYKVCCDMKPRRYEGP